MIRRTFGKIKLAPLKEYKVPAEIEAIEENGEHDEEWLSIFSRLSENRCDEATYLEACTTMVYLEEAAQSKFLNQFKTKNIRLERSDNDEFCLENNVNMSMICLICIFVS